MVALVWLQEHTRFKNPKSENEGGKKHSIETTEISDGWPNSLLHSERNITISGCLYLVLSKSIVLSCDGKLSDAVAYAS